MQPVQLPGTSRYHGIADRFESSIAQGAIAAGDRLPSVRELSRAEGVSMSTAMAAFRLLEQRGFAVARPQSGFFAQRPATADPLTHSRPRAKAETVAVTDLISEIIGSMQAGEGFPLGAAILSADLLPLKTLGRSLGRLLRTDSANLLGSMSSLGALELRQAIAGRMARAGCRIHPDHIIITSGASEAVALALRAVTRKGDVVAFESPTFYGSLMSAESCGLQALEIATDPHNGLSVDAFEAACRKRPPTALIVSGNVQNPTGACMPESEKKRLLAVAHRFGVVVIEDDIFGEFARYSGKGCSSIKAFDQHDAVIYCSSFSKVISPGIRLGWIAPGKWLPEIRKAKMAQSWGSPPLTQRALAKLLREASFENHLRRLVRTIDDTRVRALNFIATHFAPGTRVATPRYGFLLWLQLPNQIDSLAFYQAALKHDVTLMPGFAFSAMGGYRDFIRLNIGYPWSPELEAALARLAKLTHSMARTKAR